MRGGEAKAAGGANVPGLEKAEAEFIGKYETTAERTETTTYLIDPFQVATAQLKSQNKVLFIDDFHTTSEDLQPITSALLKAETQIGVKIFLAEVPHNSDFTISSLPDVTTRVKKCISILVNKRPAGHWERWSK